ncbi:MAG TPA: hypothetical protein VGX23_02020 [Actinocrinis sp.]|nr:hypothetical protein [Actinocrinis sp.]
MAADASRTVLVDMDGVLADFDRRVAQALLDKCPRLRDLGTRREFRLTTAFPEYDREISSVTSRSGFFRELPVIEGALAGWKRIEAAGFTPRVCSSPLRRNHRCEQNKRWWLAHYLGRDVARQAIIDSDKAAHRGVALIDDRTDIVGAGGRAAWQLVLFDASYNRGYDAPRLLGWQDPNLESILHAARTRYLERFSR